MFFESAPIGGEDPADAASYVKKMEKLTYYINTKRKDGSVRKLNYKIAAVCTDSASVMVSARTQIAELNSLIEHGCHFHSTDLAAGKSIDAIPFMKSAVDDANFVAGFVKKRARVLVMYNRFKDKSNGRTAQRRKAN
jgi:hypothetical protein